MRLTITLAVAAAVVLATVVVGVPGSALAQAGGNDTSSTVESNASVEGNESVEDSPTNRSTDQQNDVSSMDGPMPNVTEAWSADSLRPTADPTVANGTVYQGGLSWVSGFTAMGGVTAYNATTGEVRWERSQLSRPSGSPTVVNGTVFVSTNGVTTEWNNGNPGLHALDAETGETEWVRNESLHWISSPLYRNGSLYAHRGSVQYPENHRTGPQTTNESALLKIDPATGRTIWSSETGSIVGSSDGVVYLTGTTDIETAGHEVRLQSDRRGLLANEKFYRFHRNENGTRNVVATTLDDGDEVLNQTLPSVTDSAPMAVGDDTIAFTDDNTLYALNSTTGKVKWSFQPPTGYLSDELIVDNGTVYVGGAALAEGSENESESQISYYFAPTTTVYAFDADDGSREWGYVMPDVGFEDEVYGLKLANDRIFVSASSVTNRWKGVVTALEPSTEPIPTANQPSDGVFENATLPILFLDKTVEDPGDTVGANRTVTITADVEVPRGNVTGVAWDVDGDGDYEREGTSITLTLEQCANRTVTARATSSGGNATTESVDVANPI